MTLNNNDSELIHRAKSADPHALSLIYERYARCIHRYIYARVGDVQLAEDLCAEVFLRMLEGMPQYEDRGWSVLTWLYRIARDRTTDTLRRHSKTPLSFETLRAISDGPETILATQFEHEEIRQTLTRLPRSQQQVIQLRFVDELSVREIAERLGRTEGSVKQLQYRGLQNLAFLLQLSNAGINIASFKKYRRKLKTHPQTHRQTYRFIDCAA